MTVPADRQNRIFFATTDNPNFLYINWNSKHWSSSQKIGSFLVCMLWSMCIFRPKKKSNFWKSRIANAHASNNIEGFKICMTSRYLTRKETVGRKGRKTWVIFYTAALGAYTHTHAMRTFIPLWTLLLLLLPPQGTFSVQQSAIYRTSLAILTPQEIPQENGNQNCCVDFWH